MADSQNREMYSAQLLRFASALLEVTATTGVQDILCLC